MAFIDDILHATQAVKHQGLLSTRTVSPWAEPVSLEDFKAHQNVLHSVGDNDILFKLSASRALIEQLTGVAMMEQTWEDVYDNPPAELLLNVRPLLSVTSITRIPAMESVAWETIDSATYMVSGNTVCVKTSWATHRGWKSFKVTYKAGYALKGAGDSSALTAARAAVPEDLRSAVLALASFFYENREGQGFEAQFKAAAERGALPQMVTQLLTAYLPWGI